MKYLNYCPHCIKVNCEQCRQFNITQAPSEYSPQRFYYSTRTDYDKSKISRCSSTSTH